MAVRRGLSTANARGLWVWGFFFVAPSQRPVFFHRYPPRCFGTLDLSIKSIASAGHNGRVRRDGSDGWRSPVPRGDNTVGRGRAPSSANHPVSRRQVQKFVKGLYCLGLRFALPEALRASSLTRCRSRPRPFSYSDTRKRSTARTVSRRVSVCRAQPCLNTKEWPPARLGRFSPNPPRRPPLRRFRLAELLLSRALRHHVSLRGVRAVVLATMVLFFWGGIFWHGGTRACYVWFLLSFLSATSLLSFQFLFYRFSLRMGEALSYMTAFKEDDTHQS